MLFFVAEKRTQLQRDSDFLTSTDDPELEFDEAGLELAADDGNLFYSLINSPRIEWKEL